MHLGEQILQLNFRLGVPENEWKETAMELAETFAAVPGLRWKVWFLNQREQSAGGIYLFEDEPSVETFLNSDLAAAVKSHPAVKDMRVTYSGVLGEPTQVTRGPL